MEISLACNQEKTLVSVGRSVDLLQGLLHVADKSFTQNPIREFLVAVMVVEGRRIYASNFVILVGLFRGMRNHKARGVKHL